MRSSDASHASQVPLVTVRGARHGVCVPLAPSIGAGAPRTPRPGRLGGGAGSRTPDAEVAGFDLADKGPPFPGGVVDHATGGLSGIAEDNHSVSLCNFDAFT